MDAVIVPASRPNETLLALANVKAADRFEVVPADRLMFAPEGGPHSR
jgi:hypothetical protein